MATIQKFEELEIWQIARVARDIFILTQRNQLAREYRLKDQIKASSGSVMDNIAEGFDRDSRLEFINFLSIAKGSCGELKSQLHRLSDCQLIDDEVFKSLYARADELNKKIAGFIGYLNRTLIKGNKFKNRA